MRPLLTVVIVLVIGCAGPAASFDPAAPCAGAPEERRPGAYPELEALIPREVDGEAAIRRESGRYCSAATLGSLLRAGITELQFAGATWQRPAGSGLALSVFRARGLTLDALADSFADGAASARRVSNVQARAETIGGLPGVRIDARTNGQPQTVLVWPAGGADTFRTIIAAGLDDAALGRAIEQFGGG